jgi:hypothetical protein
VTDMVVWFLVLWMIAVCGCLILSATGSRRCWSGKTNVHLRLVVKDGDEILWRTVRGRLLVGYPATRRWLRACGRTSGGRERIVRK